MEEKKTTKVSLSTFLLILTIIALGVMGFFLYKINDEKTKATEQVSELNNQVTSLEKTVDSLQKNIDNVSTISNKINKEIFRRVKTENISETELKQYPEKYIVLEGTSIYFSSNLANKVLEGTYKVNDTKIDYNLLKDTQDYAFYTAASYKFETINGKKNIVVDNGENGIMYFEKVD
ncbi:MAG: hypothetical protein J5881_01430 [Clostridia bacterium]|nr:hypothetical protein [Clostridia bacterium]